MTELDKLLENKENSPREEKLIAIVREFYAFTEGLASGNSTKIGDMAQETLSRAEAIAGEA